MKKYWVENMLPVKRHVVIAPSWKGNLEVTALCDNLELQVSSATAEVFKDDAAAKVVATDFFSQRLIVKQYNPKNLLKLLSRMLRK